METGVTPAGGRFAGFVMAAPRSGEGKTTASLALIRALRGKGLAVQAFKCGPDYIDPGFLAAASGRPCRNLDTWLMGGAGVRATFARHVRDADAAVVEGVMGLLDGREGRPDEDRAPAGSSLDCAVALGLPVLLVVNGRGMALSIAALAEGFCLAARRAGTRVAGVLATRVGSARHAAMLEDALGRGGLPPLLGCLPADDRVRLPSRQLGLVPAAETGGLDRVMAALDELAAGLDTERIMAACACLRPAAPAAPAFAGGRRPGRLAVARDEAFCFYYEENLAWLAAMGWEIVPFSPLRDSALPACDALYLGGGYPEVFAARLAANRAMRAAVRAAADAGLPVYAECGGYMYLATELVTADGVRHAMCGVIAGTARMGTGIRSLAYREARLAAAPFGLDAAVPAFPAGTEPGAGSRGGPDGAGGGGLRLRGHEFHWSDMTLARAYPPLCHVRGRDGSLAAAGVIAGPRGNVLASYLHFYWAGGGPGARERAAGTSAAKPAARGCLILITGPSSAGKSTQVRAVAAALGRAPHAGAPVVTLSLDAVLAAFTAAGRALSSLEAAEAAGLPVLAAYHAAIGQALRRGRVLVCDHVLCGHPEWERDLLATVADSGADTLYVRLSCPEATLREREESRADRPGDWPHARAQALAPAPALPDLLDLDSGASAPDALAARVLAEMASRGLPGGPGHGDTAGITGG